MLELDDDSFNEICVYLQDKLLYSLAQTCKSLCDKIRRWLDKLIKQKFKLFIKDQTLKNPMKSYNVFRNVFVDKISLDFVKMRDLIEKSIERDIELYVVLNKTMANTIKQVHKHINLSVKLINGGNFDLAIDYLNDVDRIKATETTMDFNTFDLVESCYKYNYPDKDKMINYLINNDRFNNCTILILSIKHDDFDTFKRLIGQSYVEDSLRRAIIYQNVKIIEYLLNNFIVTDKNIETAIILNCNKNVAIDKLLLETNKYDPDYIFKHNNDIIMMKYLVKNHDIRLDYLKEAINHASINNNHDLLHVLAKSKSINEIDFKNFICNNDIRKVSTLIETMVNINNYKEIVTFQINHGKCHLVLKHLLELEIFNDDDLIELLKECLSIELENKGNIEVILNILSDKLSNKKFNKIIDKYLQIAYEDYDGEMIELLLDYKSHEQI